MRPSFQKTAFALVITGCLVLLNVLALRAFKRVDLTRDRMYTLSQATRDALANLEDPVTISAYFTENLPPPYSQNARYVRDLLEEYRAVSKGKVAFEFKDPTKAETAEDKQKKKEVKRDIFGRAVREQTDVEKDLAQQGLTPLEIRVIEEDQQQSKLVYMGLSLKYLDKRESIPAIAATDTLEYDLTTLIKKMTRKKAPVVALALPTPSGEEPSGLQFNQLRQLFEQMYEVRPLDVNHLSEVPKDVDALFVMGPSKKVEEPAQRAIDGFLLQGKSAAFFLDVAQPDLRSFVVTPVEHSLGPMLSSYGVKLGDSLVADVNCASLNIPEQRGMYRFAVPKPYPFIPIVLRLESGNAGDGKGESPLTKGLTKLHFPFVGPLSLEPRDGLTETVLAKSSDKSWLEPKPFNTDPRRDWRQVSPSFGGPYPLLVEISGKLKSHFGEQMGAKESRIIVGSSSAIAGDEFMHPVNQALMMNVADYLLLEPAMLAMRTRGLSEAPLKPDLSDGVRNGVKYGNAVGVPLLLALCGLGLWRVREWRRALVSV